MTKNVFSQILASQNIPKSAPRPTLGIISVPNHIKKSHPTHWKPQNLRKTLKFNWNRPEYFPGSAAEAKPIKLIDGRAAVANVFLVDISADVRLFSIICVVNRVLGKSFGDLLPI